MTEELCRAKFEAWVARGMTGLLLKVTLRRCEYSEDYFHSNTQAKWEGWQAAWNTRAEMEKSDD